MSALETLTWKTPTVEGIHGPFYSSSQLPQTPLQDFLSFADRLDATASAMIGSSPSDDVEPGISHGPDQIFATSRTSISSVPSLQRARMTPLERKRLTQSQLEMLSRNQANFESTGGNASSIDAAKVAIQKGSPTVSRGNNTHPRPKEPSSLMTQERWLAQLDRVEAAMRNAREICRAREKDLLEQITYLTAQVEGLRQQCREKKLAGEEKMNALLEKFKEENKVQNTALRRKITDLEQENTMLKHEIRTRALLPQDSSSTTRLQHEAKTNARVTDRHGYNYGYFHSKHNSSRAMDGIKDGSGLINEREVTGGLSKTDNLLSRTEDTHLCGQAENKNESSTRTFGLVTFREVTGTEIRKKQNARPQPQSMEGGEGNVRLQTQPSTSSDQKKSRLRRPPRQPPAPPLPSPPSSVREEHSNLNLAKLTAEKESTTSLNLSASVIPAESAAKPTAAESQESVRKLPRRTSIIVPAEEDIAKMKSLFKRVDEKNCGKVDARQLINELRSLPDIDILLCLPQVVDQAGKSKNAIDSMIQCIDMNNGSDVSWDDLLMWFLTTRAQNGMEIHDKEDKDEVGKNKDSDTNIKSFLLEDGDGTSSTRTQFIGEEANTFTRIMKSKPTLSHIETNVSTLEGNLYTSREEWTSPDANCSAGADSDVWHSVAPLKAPRASTPDASVSDRYFLARGHSFPGSDEREKNLYRPGAEKTAKTKGPVMSGVTTYRKSPYSALSTSRVSSVYTVSSPEPDSDSPTTFIF